jgi:hypothetical protein
MTTGRWHGKGVRQPSWRSVGVVWEMICHSISVISSYHDTPFCNTTIWQLSKTFVTSKLSLYCVNRQKQYQHLITEELIVSPFANHLLKNTSRP